MSDNELDALYDPLEAALDNSDSILANAGSVSRYRASPEVTAPAAQPIRKATLASRMTRTEPPSKVKLPHPPTQRRVGPAALPDRSRKVCLYYKQGSCYFRAGCRDLHEQTAPRVADTRAQQPSQQETSPEPITSFAPQHRPLDRKRKRSDPDDRGLFFRSAPVPAATSNAPISPYKRPQTPYRRAPRAPVAPFSAAPAKMRANPAIKSYTDGGQPPPRDSFVQHTQGRAKVVVQDIRADAGKVGKEGLRKHLRHGAKRMKSSHGQSKEEKVKPRAGGLDYGDEV